MCGPLREGKHSVLQLHVLFLCLHLFSSIFLIMTHVGGMLMWVGKWLGIPGFKNLPYHFLDKFQFPLLIAGGDNTCFPPTSDSSCLLPVYHERKPEIIKPFIF